MTTSRHTFTASQGPSLRPCLRWLPLATGVATVFSALAFLPMRSLIPPLVESDYCYLLLAADRLYAGLGLTSLQPVAPLQPWDWRYDWGFLTQWPVGYPLIVCAVRYVSGLASLPACQWINVAACTAALIGWFTWIKSVVPRGLTGALVAAVGAGCSLSAGLLVDASTDVIVVGLLPFVLRFVTQAFAEKGGDGCVGLCPGRESTGRKRSERRSMVLLALCGLIAGGLFWIRYASVFVPFAVGMYLLIEWRAASVRRAKCTGDSDRRRQRVVLSGPRDSARRVGASPSSASLRTPKPAAEGSASPSPWHVAVFTACAGAPVVALLSVNRVFGSGPTLSRFNLGNTIRFDISPRLIARAWWNFTDLGFYDYHWFSHWLFALWPVALLCVVLVFRGARRRFVEFTALPAVRLGIAVTASSLAMLIAASGLFGDKYDYVGLERYYLPIRPLYILLFVAPVAYVPLRSVRAVACAGMMLACSWLVQMEWSRPYKRRMTVLDAVTPYGQWARCFEPGAAVLYAWLRVRAGSDLIVLSNFHEYIALETGIPALPVPKDVDTLDNWIERICAARGITNPRVLFVLDTKNKDRDYWVASPETVIRTFALTGASDAVPHASALIMDSHYPRA